MTLPTQQQLSQERQEQEQALAQQEAAHLQAQREALQAQAQNPARLRQLGNTLQNQERAIGRTQSEISETKAQINRRKDLGLPTSGQEARLAKLEKSYADRVANYQGTRDLAGDKYEAAIRAAPRDYRTDRKNAGQPLSDTQLDYLKRTAAVQAAKAGTANFQTTTGELQQVTYGTTPAITRALQRPGRPLAPINVVLPQKNINQEANRSPNGRSRVLDEGRVLSGSDSSVSMGSSFDTQVSPEVTRPSYFYTTKETDRQFRQRALTQQGGFKAFLADDQTGFGLSGDIKEDAVYAYTKFRNRIFVENPTILTVENFLRDVAESNKKTIENQAALDKKNFPNDTSIDLRTPLMKAFAVAPPAVLAGATQSVRETPETIPLSYGAGKVVSYGFGVAEGSTAALATATADSPLLVRSFTGGLARGVSALPVVVGGAFVAEDALGVSSEQGFVNQSAAAGRLLPSYLAFGVGARGMSERGANLFTEEVFVPRVVSVDGVRDTVASRQFKSEVINEVNTFLQDRRGEVGGRSAKQRSGRMSQAELRERKSDRANQPKFEVITTPTEISASLRGKARARTDEARILEAQFTKTSKDARVFFEGKDFSAVVKQPSRAVELRSLDVALPGERSPRIEPNPGRTRSPTPSQDPFRRSRRKGTNRPLTLGPSKEATLSPPSEPTRTFSNGLVAEQRSVPTTRELVTTGPGEAANVPVTEQGSSYYRRQRYNNPLVLPEVQNRAFQAQRPNESGFFRGSPQDRQARSLERLRQLKREREAQITSQLPARTDSRRSISGRKPAGSLAPSIDYSTSVTVTPSETVIPRSARRQRRSTLTGSVQLNDELTIFGRLPAQERSQLSTQLPASDTSSITAQEQASDTVQDQATLQQPSLEFKQPARPTSPRRPRGPGTRTPRPRTPEVPREPTTPGTPETPRVPRPRTPPTPPPIVPNFREDPTYLRPTKTPKKTVTPRYGYQASLTAGLLNIKGKPSKLAEKSGLGLRPIPVRSSKKKKKRGAT